MSVKCSEENDGEISGFVRQGHSPVGIAEAHWHELFEQTRIQHSTNAATMMRLSDVRGYFDGPTVSRTLTVGRSIRISDALATAFGDEELPTRQGLPYSRSKLLDRWGHRLAGLFVLTLVR